MGALSSVVIAQFLGASIETQLLLAPKSVTAPVAMAISEQIGGLPSLTAVLVVCAGILGAIVGTRILDALHIKDDSIKGIGTAKAFQISNKMSALSGLAMALATFTTVFILPWLMQYLV
jgi:putative effector of murein hydrolase